MNDTRAHVATLPRQILVAVDTESLSDDAVRQALELGRRFGAQVELIHAVEAPLPGVTLASERERVTQHLAQVTSADDRKAGGVVERLHVASGRPGSVVLDRARETSTDLIVLGVLRRRRGVDFGSTARTVLAKSTCAVWVQAGAVAPISRILVPVDLSDESMIALATACALAQKFGGSVTAVHVFDSSRLATGPWQGAAIVVEQLRQAARAAFESALSAFDWKGVAHESSFVDGIPAAEILERAKAADLVVMGTHGRTALASVLLGSTAYYVLKGATKPVMVVRKPGRKFED